MLVRKCPFYAKRQRERRGQEKREDSKLHLQHDFRLSSPHIIHLVGLISTIERFTVRIMDSTLQYISAI
jgi:hypothetical protein